MKQSKSSRIIVIVAALPPPVHGQSAVTQSIVNALQNSSSKIIIADTSPKSLVRSLSYHFRRLRKHFMAFTLLALNSFEGNRRVYTVVESGGGIIYNIGTAIVSRLLGYEIFLHHHTARHLKQRDGRFDALAHFAGRNATHIVLSDKMAGDLRTRYPAVRRTLTLNNARNVSLTKQPPPETHQRLTLGLLSNLSAEKGLDTAIATCFAANVADLSIKLLLAGPLSDVGAQSSINSIRNRADIFEYLGPLYGEAKTRFFSRLDVFLFPTHYANEAQPLVVLEAMAAGVPVIANDRGYIAETIGSCGVVVPTGDSYPQAAVERLKHWIEDNAAFTEARNKSLGRFTLLQQSSNQQFNALLSAMTTKP